MIHFCSLKQLPDFHHIGNARSFRLDAENGHPNVAALAAWATAGPGQTVAFGKIITTGDAVIRIDYKLFLLPLDGTPYIFQVIIHILFLNGQNPGQLQCVHLHFR